MANTGSSSSNLLRARRVLKELRQLHDDPPSSVYVLRPNASSSDEDNVENIFQIEAQIAAPPGTPWEGGVFDVNVSIPERYPFEPPNVVFKTQIYHPNIDSRGRICLSTLNMPSANGTWKPSSNIRTVLVSILCLIGEPNGDDGLMKDITEEFVHRRAQFEEKARQWTRKYAMGKSHGDDGVGSFGDAGAAGSARASGDATEKRKTSARVDAVAVATAVPETYKRSRDDSHASGAHDDEGDDDKENAVVALQPPSARVGGGGGGGGGKDMSAVEHTVRAAASAMETEPPKQQQASTQSTGLHVQKRSRLQKRPRPDTR